MKLKTRHEERVLAFLFLYSLLYDTILTKEDLYQQFLAFAENTQHHITTDNSFAWELSCGVWENTVAIDALLKDSLHTWKLERVAKTELCILRIALYEAVLSCVTPYKVALKEALTLVKKYSGEDACPFVNAILDAVYTKTQKIQ